jgi:hypothetical protein
MVIKNCIDKNMIKITVKLCPSPHSSPQSALPQQAGKADGSMASYAGKDANLICPKSNIV